MTSALPARLLPALAALLLASVAHAEPPNLVPYVGYLDYGGAPVNGNIAMQFRIVDAGGAVKWGPETYDQTSPVPVVSGRFSVALGSKTAIAPSLLQGTSELYITVSVGTITGTSVSWVALAGRQRLLATPYALTAATAKDLNVSGNVAIGGTLTVTGNTTAANVAATNVTAASVTTTGNVTTGGAIGVGGATPAANAKVVQFPNVAGDKVLLATGHGVGVGSNNVSVFVPDAAATFSVRRGSSSGTESFKVNGAGDVTVPGTLEVARGIQSGSPTGIGNDLGLYSHKPGDWIRYVTNNGRHAWFQDDLYGVNPVMTIEPGGKFTLPKCRICLKWQDANGGGPKRYTCVKMADGEQSGWMNLAGTVDGNDRFALKFVCDGGGTATGDGDGP